MQWNLVSCLRKPERMCGLAGVKVCGLAGVGGCGLVVLYVCGLAGVCVCGLAGVVCRLAGVHGCVGWVCVD